MTLARIIRSAAVLSFALWTTAAVFAEQIREPNSTAKRYNGGMYGDPQKCAWQACAIDNNCVVVHTHCGGPMAVNRDSALPAQKYLDSIATTHGCFSTQAKPLVEVECVNNRCGLVVDDRRNLCQQRARSEVIIRRCLAGELDLCPEAANRADVWSLQPGFDAILEQACNREHGRSCYVLGAQLSDKIDSTAMHTRACELKFAHACYILGQQNDQKDRFNTWFSSACDINPKYCLMIGNQLTEKSDASVRSEWYKRGCEQGHVLSCNAIDQMVKALQAEALARERELERSRELEITARQLWQRLVRENPEEMEGATYLGVLYSKPGYAVSRFYSIEYSTKDGQTKRIVLPLDLAEWEN